MLVSTRHRLLSGAFLLLMAALPVRAQQFTPQVQEFIRVNSPTVALTDAKVIDGTGRPAQLHQTVVLRQGRIVQVGPAKKVKVPADAQVINCAGKTLIPGLVMLHEHLYYTMPTGSYFNIAQMPYSFPRLYLAGGATTIRTAGSIEPQTDLAIQRMVREGKLIGPEMDVTAPYMEEPALDIPALNTIKGPEDAAATTTFWANKGCTSFKMYMHATRADLAAVVREAHARQLKVTGHLCSITYREAAEIGIDNLEHGFMASSDFVPNKAPDVADYPAGRRSLLQLPVNSPAMQDLMRFLISKKVALTSTLPVFEPYTGREVVLGGGLSALLPQLQERETATWQQNQQKDSASVRLFKKEMAWEKQFYDAGGLLVAGTDPTGAGRTIAGYANRRQIELLVEAGFTPVQAIKISTLNGAIYLGRDKEIGTIEAGKQADLVLIDGDPEKDIQQVRRMELVFKQGVGFDSMKLFDSMKGKVGLN
ncbi:imidazolonepropionase-like amidohydrolase [Hymenobacter luteus]|uniref:Imidazolonepropionase-like amidohydrolase n=2 Tax=Hymenobacter TaxID=89966 RepID=A0A7W9T1J7_9BACT|nr:MULTISPECIES: amidohydrolase family protein [Hymenobacter]MBB4601676.1 imidazolonepropionase-like amidohydrolase [Hymenobacter latericoloratus]MBB6059896.1 imidazolonepropionase-like amidohydrolase [Hymenobacter luteus]